MALAELELSAAPCHEPCHDRRQVRYDVRGTARGQSSLGYEHYDARLSQSPAFRHVSLTR